MELRITWAFSVSTPSMGVLFEGWDEDPGMEEEASALDVFSLGSSSTTSERRKDDE